MALPAAPANITYSSVTQNTSGVQITGSAHTVILRGDMAVWDDTSAKFVLPETTNLAAKLTNAG